MRGLYPYLTKDFLHVGVYSAVVAQERGPDAFRVLGVLEEVLGALQEHLDLLVHVYRRLDLITMSELKPLTLRGGIREDELTLNTRTPSSNALFSFFTSFEIDARCTKA